MRKTHDPPTMNDFPEVYVLALNKLQDKISDEQSSIQLFEQNTTQLNQILARSNADADIKNERQFVYKVNVIEGVYSQNPIFNMAIDTNDSAEIPFSEFESGDAMLSLPNAANSIGVTVLKENRDPVYSYNIDLGEFGDRKRRIMQTSGEYKGQLVTIEYEGQIIYNQSDYHKGLLYINNQKIEDSKRNKYDFTRMRDDLLDLFKDQNLRASVVREPGAVVRNSLPLTASQFDNSGPAPVLRNSQISNNYITRDFQPNTTPVTAGRSSALASGPDYVQSPAINTQPTEFGNYGSGFAGYKNEVKNMAQNIMPKTRLSWSAWVHILFYINLALLVVSFFVNWDRASFLSMLMAIVYITWYLLREDFDSLLPPIFLVVGYTIAFAFDLTWLIMASRNLWVNDRYIHDGSLAGLDKFMIINSYIIIFIEFAAILVSGMLLWKGMFTNREDFGTKTEVPIRF